MQIKRVPIELDEPMLVVHDDGRRLRDEALLHIQAHLADVQAARFEVLLEKFLFLFLVHDLLQTLLFFGRDDGRSRRLVNDDRGLVCHYLV